jgi:glycerol-3-phosphate acyltransferase PlsY
MDLFLALLAAAVGYLLGSISFARVITRIVAPHKDITQVSVDVGWSEDKVRVETISATTVSIGVGRKFGFLTFVLDVLKVALPTLAFRLLYPADPYFLVVAVTGLAGHNWPVYYRFQGGRGFSALYGGLFVIDWTGVFVTLIGGLVLSVLIFRDLMLVFSLGLWLLPPYLWLRTHDWAYLAYGVAVAILINISLWPETRQYFLLRKSGQLGELSAMMERHTAMWGAIARIGRRLNIAPQKPRDSNEPPAR